jgi:hypothetical protein
MTKASDISQFLKDPSDDNARVVEKNNQNLLELFEALNEYINCSETRASSITTKAK